MLRGVVYRLIEYLASMGHSSTRKLICAISFNNILTVGVHLPSTPSMSGPGSATAPCQRVGDLQYEYLSYSSCSWHCTKCDSANYSNSITLDLNSFTTTNRFSTLNTSQDCIFTPTQTSTPAKKKPVKDSSTRHVSCLFEQIWISLFAVAYN